jgi:hypothetical protein
VLSDPKLGAVAATSRSVDGFFAPGQFFDLDDAERLSQPSFQRMPAGVRIEPAAAGADPTAFAVRAALGYETIPSAPGARYRPNDATMDTALQGDALSDRARRWHGPRRPVLVRARRYVLASTETLLVDDTATPKEGFASRAQAEQAIRAAATADPARAALLQIVERAA